MAHSRTDLQTVLENTLGSDSVYFQPPENLKISYPAIIYELNAVDTRHANNKIYSMDESYSVTLIHKNPDNEIFKKIFEIPKCSFDRHFKTENLNHYVFTIYF